MRILAWAMAAMLAAMSMQADAQAAPGTAAGQDRAAQLRRLYAEYWDALLRRNPLQATFQGHPRHNDHLPNYLSPAFRRQNHDFTAEWLARVEAVGEDGLHGQDLLSYRIFVRNARQALEGDRFPGWMLPVSQYSSPATLVAMLGSGASAQPFDTVADYDAWARRALGAPALFDQAIANMREGMAAGVVQPRELVEKVPGQLDALIRPSAEQTVFWGPVLAMPDTIPEAERERIAGEYKRLIETRLMPAYRRLRGFIATEYLPATRTSAGLGELPGGPEWYAYSVRQATTTALPPDDIHRLGRDEVQRLRGEIRALMKQARFRGSMARFFRFMRQDPRFRFADADAMLEHYRALQARVEPEMPGLVAAMPAVALEIGAVEAHRALSAPTVAYLPPRGDGPGMLQLNVHDLDRHRTWEAEALFLHEAVPGHHLQLSMQRDLHDLPAFRRQGGETAFTEGWGLYAESLGGQVGLYGDPYSRFGHLHSELLRTLRLVVDTGVHSQGWSRGQAIDYLVDNAGISRDDAIAETERCMANPGHALAHRIGMMKFAELRGRAQAALGDGFDLATFHAVVLRDGSLPLDVLEARVDAWIAGQQG